MKNVQEGVHIYSGGIVRGDGHHKLARRVIKMVGGKKTRPWNVLLGWVGVDNALLAPPSLAHSESLALPHVRKVMQYKIKFRNWHINNSAGLMHKIPFENDREHLQYDPTFFLAQVI